MSDRAIDPGALVHFLRLANRLKRTVRTGWIDRGIPATEAESVSDHSMHVALLAWVASYAEPSLDRERVLKLALIHDLAEAITGDQTPYAREEIPAGADAHARAAFLNQRHQTSVERTAAKRIAERHAFDEMTRGLPEIVRAEFSDLWWELEERTSPEARFVKQVDKLETYLQSLEYQTQHPGLPIASFAAEVTEIIDIRVLSAIRDAIGRDLGTEATHGNEPSTAL